MTIAYITAVTLACVEAALSGSIVAQSASPEIVDQAAVETVQPVEEPANNSNELLTPPISDPEQVSEALAFADVDDEAVMSLVLDYLQNITTQRGDFTQIAPSGTVSKGTFHLRRPNQLRFEYTPPTPLLIVATQGNVYVRDEELETTDFYPIKRTPLRFLLGKKVDLGDARLVAVDRGVNSVAVTLASDDEETEGELSLVLSAPELKLEQWVVRDLQNGITVVTLENVVEGEKFRNRLFRIPDAGGKQLKN